MTESVKDYYDRTALEYDNEYDVPYWKLYHEIIWENIKLFLPKNKDAIILDAGGGTGYWAIRLAQYGYKVGCHNLISLDILAPGKKATRPIRGLFKKQKNLGDR